MRIAVLYSGFLRIWDHAMLTNKAYLFTEETDLYFYVYDEKPGNVPVKQYVQIKTPIQKELVYYSSEYYEKLKDKHPKNKRYNPKAPTYHANLLQQWHNLFVGFCLVPTDYDVYVRSRGDIILHGKIDFHKYDFKSKTIYIPSGNDWAGINDQFAFGNYEVMRIYCEIYLEQFKLFGYQIPYSPETAVLDNLLRNNIKIVRVDPPNTLERPMT